MKILFQYLLIISCLIQTACGQSKGVNGVYAGVQLMPSTMMGGGMNRIDVVILFRDNGTYNDDLSKSDWQSRVTGRYTVSGGVVSLHETGDKEATTYKLTKSGDMDAGSFNLIKQPMDNRVPKGYFEFTSASGSGGGSSGMVYVGSSSNAGLFFDGKGNFSNNNQSATVVAGEGIGGGGSRKSSGQGTYTISKGVLTLKFDDGKTQVHSFFCRPGYDPVMAAIDGDIYFMKDAKKAAAKGTGRSSQRAVEKRTLESDAPSDNSSITSTAKSILLKANAAHGGAALDNIKTAKFTANIQGLQATGMIDIINKRSRVEVRQNGQLIQIEQVEGENGWQWQAGKLGTLPKARLAKIRGGIYSGILGLRNAAINSAKFVSVKKTATGMAVVYEQDAQRYAFMIDDSGGRLNAGADQTGSKANTSAYSNFKTVSGVLLPFSELNVIGGQRVSVQYQQFMINPSFSESDWAKP